MKAVKIIAILLAIYVVIVVVFETQLGYLQPESAQTIVISTTDDAGNVSPRVVRRLLTDGRLYVAVNHWPRAWYGDVLERPAVQVTMDGTSAAYTAVPVEGAEFDRVTSEYALGLVFRVLTGFPPRRLVRLDPA